MLLDRQSRRDHCAASVRRLDHDHRMADAADDTIPTRKQPRTWRLSYMHLTDDRTPMIDDPLKQTLVLGRIRLSESTSEYDDCPASQTQSGPVHLGIDPTRSS